MAYTEGRSIPPSIANTEYADRFTYSNDFTLAILYRIFIAAYKAAINTENQEKVNLKPLIIRSIKNPAAEEYIENIIVDVKDEPHCSSNF